jgi:outer membrane receptor protein involved in Fe transport
VDVLGGHSDKTFGARGYYGAPASLPSEETLRDSLLLASAQTGNLDAEYTRFAFAWRELRDSYLLDASRPALYRNRHHSRLLTLAFDRRLELNESWALLGRVELEREDLDSVYEGTVPASGLGEHWRARAGALVMPEYRMGDWRLTAGLRATGFTDDRAAWLPAAGIAWTPRPHTEISLGYSETVCLPSYTELNYNSPSSLGNAGLERRHARSLELKAAAPVADRHRVEAVAFARRESETVDWIRTAPGVPWHAANLDSLDVLGLELELETEITPSLLIEVGAQLLRKRTADEPYAGRYALDYPGESARLAVIWHAAPWCELRAEQRVDRWSRNPERDTDRTAWLGAVTLAARPPQHPRLSAAIGLENVWDVAHQPVLGVEAPGRQLRTSLTYDW